MSGLRSYFGYVLLLTFFFFFLVDINSRMPREEAGAIFELIKPIGMCLFLFPRGSVVLMIGLALGIDPKLFVEIMGSYRR